MFRLGESGSGRDLAVLCHDLVAHLIAELDTRLAADSAGRNVCPHLGGHALDVGGIAGAGLGVVDGVEGEPRRCTFHAGDGIFERGAWQGVPAPCLVLALNLEAFGHP
ncbi:hypothetical protein D3C78_1461890 [compost metagenome]